MLQLLLWNSLVGIFDMDRKYKMTISSCFIQSKLYMNDIWSVPIKVFVLLWIGKMAYATGQILGYDVYEEKFFLIHFSETTKTSLECFMDGPVENAKFFVPLVKWRLSSTKHIFYSCWSEIREWPPLPEKFKRTLLKIILSKVYSEKLQTHCPQMIL